MALTAANTPANQGYPGVATNDGQNYATTYAVAAGVVSEWKNPTPLIGMTDRKLSSDWPSTGGSTKPPGDTITIEKAQRYRVRRGSTFDQQPNKAETETIQFNEPWGVDTGSDMWVPVMFQSPEDVRRVAARKTARLLDEVEGDVAREARRYHRTIGTVHGNSLIAPGSQSTAANPNRGAKLILDEKAYLMKTLGMLRGTKLCLDPMTGAAMNLDLLNAPYEAPYSGSVRSSGSQSGTRLGVDFKPSIQNGVQAMGNMASSGAVQVATAPSEGGNTVELKTLTSGTAPAPGTSLSFENTNAVNRTTGAPTGYRQHFKVVSVAAGGGTTPLVTVDPPFRSATNGENIRDRNCTQRPAANAKVYFNDLDTSEVANRTAYQGKSVDVNFLGLADTISLTISEAQVPPRGVIRGAMIRSAKNKIAMSDTEAYDVLSHSTKHRLDERHALLNWEREAGVVILGGEV